jgi:hypothetical protein
MSIDPVEAAIGKYIDDFTAHNKAANLIAGDLRRLGVGFRPVVDHITFRTLNVLERAEEFLDLGFVWDTEVGNKGLIDFDDWWARVLRKPGFPAIFIDQPYEGERGKTSVIAPWVERFTDRVLHHIAVLVDDIDWAVTRLKKQGILCAGSIVGERGSDLRQIFTQAEVCDGHPFSVIELTERHHGYKGFLPPQAQGLMQSSTQTRRQS